MNRKLEIFCYGLLLVGLLAIALIPLHPTNMRTTYCVIDVVEAIDKYEFVPSTKHKYHTKCGFTFTSEKVYRIGESVEVKTILVDK